MKPKVHYRTRPKLLKLLLVSLFLWDGYGNLARAGAIKLPADLDLVPRQAAGFLHIRAADIWQSPWNKDLRYILDKAGPEAWKEFAKKSPLEPSSLDRLTFIFLTPQTLAEPFPRVDPEAASTLVAVTTQKPYDRLKLIQNLGAREKVFRSHLYYFYEDLWSGLYLIDENTFLLGSEGALIRFFEMARNQERTGPLQAGLEEASKKNHLVFGLNPTLLGSVPFVKFLPGPVLKLLEAHGAFLTMSLEQGIRADLRLDFPTQDQAKEGEKALRGTLELARQGLSEGIRELERELKDPNKNTLADLPEQFAVLLGLGFLREIDTQLKEATIQRQDKVVQLPWTYKKLESSQLLLVSTFAMAMVGLSVSRTFADVSSSEKEETVEKHLRNLAQALDKFHDKHGHYPPRVLHDHEGRPVLSWRVALLPFIGEEALYNEFKLDEPWDSLHNQKLLKRMPKALSFRPQYYYGTTRWKTATQVFAGPNTNFADKKGLLKGELAKKSALLAYAGDDYRGGSSVYWTKPADLPYAPGQPLPNLFGRFGYQVHVLLADGTYRTVDKSTDEKTLRDLIERTKENTKKPEPPETLETHWRHFMHHDDAGIRKAWHGMAAMMQNPQQAVPFIKERVKPAPRPDLKRIAQNLGDLDSPSFKVRELAFAELKKWGELAIPLVEKKLKDKTLSLEAQRRMESLMQQPKNLLSAEEMRSIRAIEVLQGIGSPQAIAILQDLAAGGEGAVLTEQAKRALTRLQKRPAP